MSIFFCVLQFPIVKKKFIAVCHIVKKNPYAGAFNGESLMDLSNTSFFKLLFPFVKKAN